MPITAGPEAWQRLGARIRAEREQMGLSRAQFAALCGISDTTIQSIEQGRTPKRWPQSIGPISRGLGWAPGRAKAILAGGDPNLAPEAPHGAAQATSAPSVGVRGPGLVYAHSDGDTFTLVDTAVVTDPRERAICAALLTRALELLRDQP